MKQNHTGQTGMKDSDDWGNGYLSFVSYNRFHVFLLKEHQTVGRTYERQASTSIFESIAIITHLTKKSPKVTAYAKVMLSTFTRDYR